MSEPFIPDEEEQAAIVAERERVMRAEPAPCSEETCEHPAADHFADGSCAQPDCDCGNYPLDVEVG